jgi:two-component system sensor histidine kinase TctE
MERLPSLRSRMLWRVLVPLAATWSIGSAAAFYLSWELAGRAFDRALLDDAYAIAANVIERDGATVLNLSPREVDNVLFDRDEKEYFAIYGRDGKLVAGNAELPIPEPGSKRPADFTNGNLGGAALRIARLNPEPARTFSVVVGQTTHSRGNLLSGLLVRSIAPQLALLLLLGLYLGRQISRELDPLRHLQGELDRRHSSDLGPIVLQPRSDDLQRLRESVDALLSRIDGGVQAQREFAGSVAHELRTPLAGIRALAEYGLAHDNAAIWRQQLQSIVLSEERASRLVDQLLALALADEARDSVKLEPVRVDELVRRTLLAFVPRADAEGVDLGAEGLDIATTVRAAPVLLEGVLANLIDNALRYGKGSAPAMLTVEIARQQGHVGISVVDSGPGLDAEQRESLRRRWTQGLAGVRLGAGAGLGLAIASRYVALMGGELLLESGPGGKGLRAVVRLRAA